MKNIYICLSLVIISIILTYSIGAFYAYFYPMKYCDEIKSYSMDFDVEPALVASVINVESGYNELSVSSKGAEGLMQIMPSTGRWLAEKLKETYEDGILLNGEYNIKLGAYYLSYLFSQFGDTKLVLCAYNAGQGKVKEWLRDERYSSDGKTLDKIPFIETENYLKKVEKNYAYYKNRYAK